MRSWLLVIVACLACDAPLWAQSAKPKQGTPAESDYYTLTPLEIPEGLVLEAGGLEFFPDGRLAVSTRRGDIYLVANPHSDSPALEFSRWAHGLHEVLGIAWHNGALYACQRPELTRIRDTNGDGQADSFETVCDGWEISGDYHEYAFTNRPDKDGNFWIVLCLTGSFSSNVPYRGWCVRVSPEGKMIPTTSGVRSPGGIGSNAAGDFFYCDNQGPWNGTSGLKHLVPGKFVGHPGGNDWYKLAPNMGPQPANPANGGRMMAEAAKMPELEPTCVYFPYGRMGQSASGIECDRSGGKFGPFQNQLFVGDQTNSTVMRVFLEKVKGHYQGACFPFISGIGSGTLSLRQSPQGAMFVGGTNRGWGSRGNKPYSLDRLTWTGHTPFEIHEMRVRPDGFELTFTQPVDRAAAENVASYKMTNHTYIYHETYGSPETDKEDRKVLKAEVAANGLSVRLTLDALRVGHVHELTAVGVKSADGLPLLHAQAYYTLNYLP